MKVKLERYKVRVCGIVKIHKQVQTNETNVLSYACRQRDVNKNSSVRIVHPSESKLQTFERRRTFATDRNFA